VKRPFFSHQRRLGIDLLPFLILTLMLSACDQGSGTGNGSVPVATRPPAASITTAGIQLGPHPCPDVGFDPAHWKALVPLTASQQKASPPWMACLLLIR
jgi:hypothetical protein